MGEFLYCYGIEILLVVITQRARRITRTFKIQGTRRILKTKFSSMLIPSSWTYYQLDMQVLSPFSRDKNADFISTFPSNVIPRMAVSDVGFFKLPLLLSTLCPHNSILNQSNFQVLKCTTLSLPESCIGNMFMVLHICLVQRNYSSRVF